MENRSSSKSVTQKGVVWLWLSVLVFVLDQWTKSIASETLKMYVAVPVNEFLNWTLMHNKGVAFSFLADQSGWQRWFLSVLAIVIVVWLLVWMYQNSKAMKLQNAALALVVGGALGNVYDRLMLGYVVDFVELHYNENYWPAFNVADSAICMGAVLLIIDAFVNKHENVNDNKA
ncbi:signal peptidase II [Marinicella rhabdoformis]|uniref:signal peptidase II n=1 Tax=Marinicella rhabdoformis TaxID=2580566 RepID=UPI0012AEDD6C|nr:signal peptidase II [Marinicella rhabdoformis]